MAYLEANLHGSLTAPLRSKSRDKVYLGTKGNGGLYDKKFARYIQFVGWLVERDLTLV